MPQKKVDANKSNRISKKNILVTLQNEENTEQIISTIIKKKQCITRSRKKVATGSPTIVAPFEPVEETESPTTSSSRKSRSKIISTKSPRNSTKKKLLTERNINVNNAKSDTAVKKNKICVRRSSGRKEVTDSSSVGCPFQFTASPAASCSRKPRKKVSSKKSPRSAEKKEEIEILYQQNMTENKKKTDRVVKSMKHCGMCQTSGIKKLAGLSSVVSPSSSKKSRRKVSKTKSPRAAKKRKLAGKQENRENNKESNSNKRKKEHNDFESEDREDNVSLVIISSAEDVALLKDIASAAASSVEQKDEENEEERGYDKKQNESVLQSKRREDASNNSEIGNTTSLVANVFSAKETASTSASSANSQSNFEEVHEMKCMICFELQEDSLFIVNSCGHSFHSLCLQTWFEVEKSCPVCNVEISTNDDALNNSGIKSNDMNRYATLSDYMKISDNESHYIDRAVNEPTKLSEDINEFLMRCVICMETSRTPQSIESHDQLSDFELMPCGHNVHAACAQTSSGVRKECPICMENSRTEDYGIYEFPEQVRCVICLDTVESFNFEYISCCHSFHQQCIQKWFAVRRGEVCPVCMVSCSSNGDEDEALYGFLENVRCTICMDIEESSEFQRVSCRHSFHTTCAKTWFLENSYCPTCMRNVFLDSTESDDEEVRCVICVDTEESSVFEFLSCCHSFHAGCIQSWLKKGKSCPICNTRILDTSNTVEIVACVAAEN